LFRSGVQYGFRGEEKIPCIHENDVCPFAPYFFNEGRPPGQTAKLFRPSAAGFDFTLNGGRENQGDALVGDEGGDFTPDCDREEEDQKDYQKVFFHDIPLEFSSGQDLYAEEAVKYRIMKHSICSFSSLREHSSLSPKVEHSTTTAWQRSDSFSVTSCRHPSCSISRGQAW
jgi:hypothetical protein